MRLRNLELWSALFIISLVTAAYLGVVSRSEIPSASGFLGHSLGVIGFVLMLMTEILYSFRKRYKFARWGKLQHWLSFHIFTGIVGPYLVLLHSSWKFNGIAGILMLLTMIIVFSGFIGRYLYTAVPRSPEGTVMEIDQLNELITQNQQQLQNWRDSNPELLLEAERLLHNQNRTSLRLVFMRMSWVKLWINNRGRNFSLIKDLNYLRNDQIILNRQLDTIIGEKRLLAIWHSVHVPLGVGTFTIALIHVVATLYYATLAN